MVASEGSTSYAIFTYKCDLLQWTKYNAAIGYSAGLNNFANHPLSRTERVINIDCLNYPSSVWSNVVYNLSEGIIKQDKMLIKCVTCIIIFE